jgi:hypothetical protein
MYLALPAGIIALHAAGFLAGRIPVPFDKGSRAALLFRVAIFIVVTPLCFCALLIGAVALVMALGI